MVQQDCPKLYVNLQGTKWSLCHVLNRWADAQAIVGKFTTHQVVG